MRTVLLRHALPDGSSHYDWMLEVGAKATLMTFRVGVRIDDPAVTHFEAERLPDHRRAYLDYEGEVSGGRGCVARVAGGQAKVEDHPGGLTLNVDWGGVHAVFRGRCVAGDRWVFERSAGADQG
ncbi:MAG: hypothetical protein HBSAPP03_01910 [Phycisphaerae bacterium]|nr:MAG: hypothetical protein HBSAPP03_01910 [Phycisphaerae bacterium]